MLRMVTLTTCLLAAGAAAQAQERPLANAGLPRSVENRLTALIEDPATKKIDGEVTMAETQEGSVVVFKGPLRLSGKINGELLVIDGNVTFESGAAVTGDVTVVGGEAFGLENASIDGTVTLYGEGFSLFSGGDKVLTVNPRTRRVYRDDDHRDWGHSNFTVRSGWNYNRVEGLPVQFGPVIETSGRNPTRVEALAIWRTEQSSPFDTEDWGYALRAEQFMFGDRDFRLGGTLKSVIDPIEDWQLTRSEASLATFVLHSDYRDYFKREGWSAYAKLAPRATGLTASIEYRDEKHFSQHARDPWTVFENNDAWRLQPLVAEGRFRSVNGAFELDNRDRRDFASDGFYVRGEITQGLSGSLELPLISPVAFNEKFTRGLIDFRVYRRVENDATLSFRGVLGGALSDGALPPQFQHALGGAGSLPGYSLFEGDCGARRVAVTHTSTAENFFAAYGCDRMAMFSAEYRGGFRFNIGGFDDGDEDEDSQEDDLGWHVDANPNWIVFFDAARGWAHDDSKARGARNTGSLYDVGLGIVLGDVGIYGAVPLSGEDRDMKLFVRLGPRF